MSKCILVVDIETTGFLNAGGKIVEIGIVSLDLETGRIIELFDQVIREDGLTAKDRDAWIFQNSNLTVEEVRNAPPAKDIFAQVQVILDAYPLGCTAFNRPFDVGFLESRGIKFSRSLQDPMILATGVCKLPNAYGRGGYKYPKVTEAYDFFFPNSGYVEAHRGLDDCRHEALVVLELYKMGLFKV